MSVAALALLLATVVTIAVSLAAATPASAAGPVWTKTYTPPGTLGIGDAHVVTSSSGDIYVAFTVQRAGSGNDLWVARYSAAGARRWQRFYDGTAHLSDTVVALVVDRDGNVTVLALSRGATTGDDMLLVRYRRDGRRHWVRRIDGGTKGQDEANDLVIDGSGNLYAVGALRRVGSGWDLAVVKLRPSGARAWTRVYDILGGTETGGPAALAPDGRLYVCGRAPGPNDVYDLLFVCFSTDGTYRWSRRWGLSDNTDLPRDLSADGSGCVAVGWTKPVSGYSNGLVLAFDPEGGYRWHDSYDGPASRYDDFKAVGLDADGRVFVAGYSTGTTLSHDFFLGRYNAAGGGLVSTARNGFEDGTDEAACLAVTRAGDAYAGGSVFMEPGHTTAFAVGMNAAWGQILLGLHDTEGNLADTYDGVALTGAAVYLAGRAGGALLLEKYAR